MAYHFSANQYEDKYSPRKLGNWEYPKWYPERPRQRFKSTKIIADDNGRLLEGIKRENAWGNYVGTWDLPRRITREYVNKLAAPPERLVNLWGTKKKDPPEKRPPEPEISQRTQKEEKSDEEICKTCGMSMAKCNCEKELPPTEPKKSDEEIETCGEPLTCAKCNHECLPTLDQSGESAAQKSFKRRNKSCSALDLRPRSTKLEPLVSLEEKQEHNIKPGELDEKIKNILESVQDKKKVSPSDVICNEIKALPRRIKQKTVTSQKSTENGEHEYLNCLDDHLAKFEHVPEDLEEEKEPEIDLSHLEIEKNKEEMKTTSSPKVESQRKPLEPIPTVNIDFQIAKKFHDENLKHKPLPDVIEDPVFKALTSGRQDHPGGCLNVDSMPSAIGWKPYNAPRPTECSKMRIFRPKTAVEKVKPPKDGRPKTGGSSFKKHFLPIDLAICWDLKPEDPSDEPKRSPHIDGSNGSVAPAVFTMIRPTEAEDQNVSGSSQAVAERITTGIKEDNVATLPSQLNGKMRSPMSILSNREAIMSCKKPPNEFVQKHKTGTPDSLNSISPNAAEFARKNPKTAWTSEDTSKVLSDRLQTLEKENCKHGSRNGSESSGMERKKHHQSTPNLANACEGSNCGTEKSNSPASVKMSECSKNRHSGNASVTSDGTRTQKRGQAKGRNCSACKNSSSDCEEIREKPEFKAAFKAGVPKSESSHSGSSSNSKSYTVPKMRLPYAKRSYSIGTLAPPFSMWRESNGQEYPEHWRLASVYQHSYKPINTRKRPLLATVYQ